MKGELVESLTVAGLDVSRLKTAEKALQESQEHLRRSQRLEKVGRLAGGVAHDFNNLLTIISGCLDLLDANLEGKDVRNLTRMTRNAAERGAFLTKQLLAFARQQIFKPEIVDLNERLREAGEMLTRLLEEDIEFATDLESDLWRVEIDPGQFEQVLVNLAINARDAMPGGGGLRLESRNVVVRGSGAAIPDQ